MAAEIDLVRGQAVGLEPQPHRAVGPGQVVHVLEDGLRVEHVDRAPIDRAFVEPAGSIRDHRAVPVLPADGVTDFRQPCVVERGGEVGVRQNLRRKRVTRQQRPDLGEFGFAGDFRARSKQGHDLVEHLLIALDLGVLDDVERVVRLRA